MWKKRFDFSSSSWCSNSKKKSAIKCFDWSLKRRELPECLYFPTTKVIRLTSN